MNFATKVFFLLLAVAVIAIVAGEEDDSWFEQNEESDTERDFPLSKEYETCVRPRKCQPPLKCNKAQICVDPKKGW
uniref:Insecticidal toxin LaIT1 n=1 Tax=Liocheles australasiae TaxID=431266 RepID=LAIT1_LIOAU